MKWHKYPEEKPPKQEPYLVRMERGTSPVRGIRYAVDIWWYSTWYSVDQVTHWCEIEPPQ